MMTTPRYGEPSSPNLAGEPLTLATLQRAVWAATPEAFLCCHAFSAASSSRIDAWPVSAKVPHRKSYWIDRDRLLDIIEMADLGVDEDFACPRRSFC